MKFPVEKKPHVPPLIFKDWVVEGNLAVIWRVQSGNLLQPGLVLNLAAIWRTAIWRNL